MPEHNADNPTIQALKKSNVSRYIQLAGLFWHRIETGEWDVGQKTPPGTALADQCGVATMTIRQSLDILENEGLIERYRAKGTFIREQPRKELWCEVNTDWSGMLIARQDASIKVLSDKSGTALPRYDGDIGIPAPSYRHLRRRHSRDGEAFLLADIYVDERIEPSIPEENYAKVTAMRLVSDIPGQTVANARQIVTIGAADLTTSNELNISIGDPVAKVQRVAVNQHGDIILVANGIYRGDMMRIEFKLR